MGVAVIPDVVPDSVKERFRRFCQWLALGLAASLGAVLYWIASHWDELFETDAEKAAKEHGKK